MVLVAIAAVHGVRAAIDDEFAGVHLAIAVCAALLAVLVAVMKEPLGPPRARQPRSAGRLTAGRWLAIAGAVASVLWWRFAPWAPKADFDMIGFLYLAENALQLLVMGGLVAMTAAGAGLWWENRR